MTTTICPRTDSVHTTFVPMSRSAANTAHLDRCVNCGETELDHQHACEGECGETFTVGDLIETRDPIGVRLLCGDCWSIENVANSRRGTALGYGAE